MYDSCTTTELPTTDLSLFTLPEQNSKSNTDHSHPRETLQTRYFAYPHCVNDCYEPNGQEIGHGRCCRSPDADKHHQSRILASAFGGLQLETATTHVNGTSPSYQFQPRPNLPSIPPLLPRPSKRLPSYPMQKRDRDPKQHECRKTDTAGQKIGMKSRRQNGRFSSRLGRMRKRPDSREMGGRSRTGKLGGIGVRKGRSERFDHDQGGAR